MDLRSLIAKMDAIESRISEAPEVATPPAAAAPANPWTNDPAKAAAWAKLSPQVQKKLGMADPTDNIIVSRMVKGGFLSGQPVTDANPDGTPKAAPQAANPAPTSGAATTQAQADANKAKVQAALPASMSMNDFDAARNASEPEEPVAGTVNNAASLKAAQDAAGNNPGTTTNQAANPAPAAPAAPINRDAMPFGKAFADARAKGEKQFTWKGKKYAVQMAAPKQAPKQAANPAPAAPDYSNGNPLMTPDGMDFGQLSAESIEPGKLAKALIESFGYTK